MKSGGPWNFKGLRPRARAASSDSAPRPDKSVGDWLNSVIQRSEGDDLTDESRLAERLGSASGNRPDRSAGADAPSMRGGPYREPGDNDRGVETRDEPARGVASEIALREEPRNRGGSGDIHARLDQLTNQLDRLAHIQAARQRKGAAPAGENERRLPEPPPQPQPQPRQAKPKLEPALSIDDAVAEIAARQQALDRIPLVQAAAERIARASDPAPPPSIVPTDQTIKPAPAPTLVPLPSVDFSSLENQLREITARIEALQPASGIEQAIASVRNDLADIGRQLNEALPRRALDSLEFEVKALGERIDQSRVSGVDPRALAGLENGLIEIREALRMLTPAENLAGFHDVVNALSQKVDLILAREDPSALQQLESAIGGLRGVVSHVASNDTLARVSDDIRTLAAQVDRIANTAATGDAVSMLERRIGALAGQLGGTVGGPATEQAVSALEQRIGALVGQIDAVAGAAATAPAIAALEQRIGALVGQIDGIASTAPAGPSLSTLEQRIDSLTAALTASSEAGHAVPRDLEQLLAGLIEKLEWVQLTHTDHAALAHLEDRIATLVQRFDTSEARLGHLEAIERGLADLLVHLDQMRGMLGDATSGAAMTAAAAPALIEREVTDRRSSEWRTQDSPEAFHGPLEHVADRLATIGSGMPRDAARDANLPVARQPDDEPPPNDAPRGGPGGSPVPPPSEPPTTAEPTDAASPQAPAARLPIDPTLPPNHPLEPRSTALRARPSAAERVSASEAALGSTKPPVISDSERPDFIAAARRAAQAAAWEPSAKKGKTGLLTDQSGPQSNKLSQRLRKLIVAGSAVLILIGAVRIATKFIEDHRQAGASQVQSTEIQPPAASPRTAEPASPPVIGPPLTLPSAPAAPPAQPPAVQKTVKPGRQSMAHGQQQQTVVAAVQPASRPDATALPSWAVPDITGALPPSAAAPSPPPPAEHAVPAVDEKLPATIGNASLRDAAMAGNPAAAYEIANRFAEGRGVLQNDKQAAYWLQRAAKQGLAPAEFRLGGLYEKGQGVDKDLGKARDLYLAAADKGNGKAMHNLAVLYAEGVDGQPDYDKAADWFRQAAAHGVRDSQFNLGILYARGIGVQQNDAESYKWFALAAKQGDADAAKKRDEIASHLDAQALAAAKLAVRNWSPDPQPDDAVNVKLAAAWASPPPASPGAMVK